METLAILLLATAFLLTRTSRLSTAVHILLAQSAVVAAACAVAGWQAGETHMFVAALLTIVVKAGLIPYALLRLVRLLKKEREVNPVIGDNMSSLAAVGAIVLAYGLIEHALPAVISRDAVATAVALVLIGLLLIMTRRQAIMQIVGLITMENGLYLLGLSTTRGLPLIIELGIFFDVLVAVTVMVILTFRLKRSFHTSDTSTLQRLKG